MRKISILMFLLALTVACSGTRQLTGYEAYAVASDEFTGLVSDYNRYYSLVDIETQVKWRDKFDPLFLEAHETFKGWRSVLDAGEDPVLQINAWNTIKTRLIMLMVEMQQEDK